MKSRRLAIWVWYRGTRFRGFQAQAEGPTVQQQLRQALTECGLEGNPVPAGRTDKGVHARMQVVAMRAPLDLDPEALRARVAARLPPDVGLCVGRAAPSGFHPQWSATGKEYRYRISLGPVSPHWEAFAWKLSEEARLGGAVLDEQVLTRLLQQSEGTRDFSAFHERSSPTGPRTLEKATVHRWESEPNLLEVRLRGDRFGRYQVRYLVGSAVAVACGAINEDRFLAAVENAEPIAGLKAPASGLMLWEVQYPPGLDPFLLDHPAGISRLPREPPFAGEESGRG